MYFIKLFISPAVHITFECTSWSWLFNACKFQHQETINKYDEGIVSLKIFYDFCVYMNDVQGMY